MTPLLQACLNGGRLPAEHPALPVSPDQLARDSAAVVTAGADAVHLHVKDADGADTLDAAVTERVLAAVRTAAPGVPVGVTTGAWAVPDPVERVAAVRRWRRLDALPDFASVNWHEDGADDVAAALLDLGVAVEAGLWHAAGVQALAASPLRGSCLRLLVELPHGPGAGAVDALARQLLDLVDSLATSTPVLLHGEGTSAWPALRLAGRLGLATRIGLEDVLHLPDGSPSSGNAQLVAAARDLLGS